MAEGVVNAAAELTRAVRACRLEEFPYLCAAREGPTWHAHKAEAPRAETIHDNRSMTNEILSALPLAISVCADCFAVSICSSLTLRHIDPRKVLLTAIVFGVMQTALLLLGWLFGGLIARFVTSAASLIGFLLLLYVGGSMIYTALREPDRCMDLRGLRNVLLGATATSIDAMMVGISLSMAATGGRAMAFNAVAVFLMTVLSVAVGMFCGYRLGTRFGKGVQILGGVVLIAIGINILL